MGISVTSDTPANGGQCVLELNGLSKSFGGLQAVRGVTLKIMPGDRKAIIGPNGEGSTCFRRMTRTVSTTRKTAAAQIASTAPRRVDGNRRRTTRVGMFMNPPRRSRGVRTTVFRRPSMPSAQHGAHRNHLRTGSEMGSDRTANMRARRTDAGFPTRPAACCLSLNPPIDCGLGGEFRCVAAAGVRAWLSARPRCRVVPLGLSARGWFGVCC